MSGLGVEGVRVAFGDRVALEGVTLGVPEGQVTAVVGGDGAGKSTLLRVFAGRARIDAGSVRTLRKHRIGYQPATSGVWGGLTVTENADFVAKTFQMGRSSRARIDELLDRAGLADARDRLGRDLSGGMRQKLGFVLAIMHDPGLVLLDEPSTGVDPVSRVDLWRLISETAASGTAVLLTTTYLDEAARASSVTALDAGSVIATGSPEDIIRDVPGRIVQVGAEEPVRRSDTWRRGAVRRRWVARSGDASSERTITPDLEDAVIALTLARVEGSGTSADSGSLAATGEPSRTENFVPPAASADRAAPVSVVAEGRAVTRRFGEHVAVDDVSVTVRPGEIVGLIGANGAGKTTFLRTLIGLDRPDEGDVTLFGGPPDAQARARLGYVPQGLGLYRTISVDANARFFARVYGTAKVDLPPGLAGVADGPVGSIGLGRQRQLAFALALAHRPELLVLDEPTSGVDPLSRARLWDTIHAQADAGVAVIVTTHYLQEAEQCSRLALMSRGRLVGEGSVAELTAELTAVEVRADHWQRAFATLGEAGLPVMLAGRAVRVAGTSVDTVRAALGDVRAEVVDVAPTLEEAMVLRER